MALGKQRSSGIAPYAATQSSSPAPRAILGCGTNGPRRLTDDDRPALTAHLLRLSTPDRALRFFRVIDDKTILDYSQRIEFGQNPCFAIFAGDGSLVALAEAFAYPDGDIRCIEVAFTTDEMWRRRGLGQLLFTEIADYASANGCDRVIAQCVTGNHSMRALLRAVGAVCEVDDGEVSGKLDLVRHA